MVVINRIITVSLFLLVITRSIAFSPKKCPRVTPCLSAIDAGRRCALLPMLPNTIAPPPGPTGYTLTRLRSFVMHFSDGAYHSVIVYAPWKRTLFVVDFPRSFGRNGEYLLGNAVAEVVGKKPVRRVIMVYSHRHLDHIGSAGTFAQMVRSKYPTAWLSIWGTLDVRERLRRNKAKVPLPTRLIRKGGVKLHLQYALTVRLRIIGGHSDTDVATHIVPAAGNPGVLHIPDLISVREAPFEAFTLTTDLQAYITAHDRLLPLHFKTLSPGHGLLGTKEDVRVSKQYAISVLSAARRAVVQSRTARSTGAVFARVGNPKDPAFGNGAWALGEVTRIQISQCTKYIVRTWGCRLSAVDVFAESHCRTAAYYLLVDE